MERGNQERNYGVIAFLPLFVFWHYILEVG
ncbi:hypothetical protein HMPREF9466_02769 [Fusobacterium necrophorum subsp. funduliforme 1_1_36S]|nr:hypothetical protein HMPREF9466_02769 [Fusobacterium necrophorum subsp. funduliforme 1_1_36S]